MALYLSSSTYTQQLHFKYQCRETRDRTARFRAITHFGWDIDHPLITHMHLLESDLPTINHIAKAESFGTIALVRIVELLAVYQSATIVYAYDATNSRRDLTFSCLQYFIIDTTRKALDAFLCG